MSPTILKRLVLAAALALSPALLFAQAMPGNATSPPNSDQTTKSMDSQTELMAYQKEFAACDKQPTADRETCRSKVDQKYAKKSSTNTPPQSSSTNTPPASSRKSTY